MGYYVVPPALSAVADVHVDTVQFVGYEMDPDLRFVVVRAIAQAVESGIDIDSDLLWTVVSEHRLGCTADEFERCRELVKSNLRDAEVE
jgi:hypothetical protein